jgi:hypothetical protein
MGEEKLKAGRIRKNGTVEIKVKENETEIRK